MLALHIYNKKSKQSLLKFFFITFSLSTELLEDKQMFKLGGVDTSLSYLLFQTLLPLFWTLTCMILMELTRTDVVFSRLSMVLFMCRKKSSRNYLNSTEHLFGKYYKYWKTNPRQGGLHLSTRVGARLPPLGAPHASWVPWNSTDLNSNSIYSGSGRKNPEKNIHHVLRYGAAANP